MLSRVDLDRLKLWQLQLKGTIAAQEHHLQSLERLILTTGTVVPVTARSLASLEQAIVVCKNTLAQFEEAANHLATVIGFYDRQANDTLPPRLQITQPRLGPTRCQNTLTHHDP